MCAKFCGLCPTFMPNKLNESSHIMLFCSRGASTVPKDQIKDNMCSCPECKVFIKYEFEGGWFCTYGKEGKKV